MSSKLSKVVPQLPNELLLKIIYHRLDSHLDKLRVGSWTLARTIGGGLIPEDVEAYIQAYGAQLYNIGTASHLCREMVADVVLPAHLAYLNQSITRFQNEVESTNAARVNHDTTRSVANVLQRYKMYNAHTCLRQLNAIRDKAMHVQATLQKIGGGAPMNADSISLC